MGSSLLHYESYLRKLDRPDLFGADPLLFRIGLGRHYSGDPMELFGMNDPTTLRKSLSTLYSEDGRLVF